VQEFVKGIDDSHDEKQSYVEAAKAFRLPYWDWAKKGNSAVPAAAMNETYDRRAVPKSSTSWFKEDTEPNPLYCFNWPEGTPEDIVTNDDEISPKPTTTIRNPPSGVDALGKGVDKDWRRANPLAPEKNLSERTAYILQSYQRYVSMSTTRLPDKQDSKGRPVLPEIYGSL